MWILKYLFISLTVQYFYPLDKERLYSIYKSLSKIGKFWDLWLLQYMEFVRKTILVLHFCIKFLGNLYAVLCTYLTPQEQNEMKEIK